MVRGHLGGLGSLRGLGCSRVLKKQRQRKGQDPDSKGGRNTEEISKGTGAKRPDLNHMQMTPADTHSRQQKYELSRSDRPNAAKASGASS